jgi:hypothetical protein
MNVQNVRAKGEPRKAHDLDAVAASPEIASNRLPVLCAEIRKAHADVQDAAKTAAQRAIDAGHLLIEAKELVPHGEWLPWLRENCALAERTAQLYMKIAKSGLESATVADLGLQGTADSLVFYIDYWSDLSEPELIEWQVFALFMVRKEGWHIEGAVAHTEWLRRANITTPSEWLFGENGNRYRRQHYPDTPPLSAAWLDSWREFLTANCNRTQQDLTAEIDRISVEQGPYVLPENRKRRRRRLPKSDPKFAAAFRRVLRGGNHKKTARPRS